MRDLYSKLKATVALNPATRTSVAAASIDMRGFNSLVCLLMVGACTDGSFAFALHESDDDSTYAAVASADLEGSLPTVAIDESPDAYSYANTVQRVGYKGNKRYVKLVATVTGSPVTGILCGATYLQSNAEVGPQA